MSVQVGKNRALQSVSLTPLIDVVFLLLIFFLVATRFAEEDRELDVLLPSATEAKPMIMKPKEIFVNIDQAGRYYVGGQFLGLDQLKQTLARVAVSNPLTQSVIIRADRRCPWDFVVQAIDVCHQVGIRDIRPTTLGQVGSPES